MNKKEKVLLEMVDELQLYLGEVHNPECCVEDGYENKCNYCLTILKAKEMLNNFKFKR